MKKPGNYLLPLVVAVISLFLFYPITSKAITDGAFHTFGHSLVDECHCGVGDPDSNGKFYNLLGGAFPAKPTMVQLKDNSMCSINDLLANSNVPGSGGCGGATCADILDDVTNDMPGGGGGGFFGGGGDPASESNNDPSVCFCGIDDTDNAAYPIIAAHPDIFGNDFGCEARTCASPVQEMYPCTVGADCSDFDSSGGANMCVGGFCSAAVLRPCDGNSDCRELGVDCENGGVADNTLCAGIGTGICDDLPSGDFRCAGTHGCSGTSPGGPWDCCPNSAPSFFDKTPDGTCTDGMTDCDVDDDCDPTFTCNTGTDTMKGCESGDSSCFCYVSTEDPHVTTAGVVPDPSNADCSAVTPPGGTDTCEPADTCVNKMNMTYAWSGQYDPVRDVAWVGLGPNTGCRAIATIALSGMDIPGSQTVFDGAAVCEPSDSTFPNFSDFTLEGDVRPPGIFWVENVSGAPDPAANQHELDLTACPNNGFELIRKLAGFRSFGILPERGLAIAAGPPARSVNPAGVIMVLIDIENKQCLEVKEDLEIIDLRKMAALNGALYAPVGLAAGQGAVLRCTGCEQDPPTLAFEVVGNLTSLGANITYCPDQGVFLVNTWPNSDAVDPGAIMVPAIDLSTITVTSIMDIIEAIQTFLGVLEDVGIATVHVSPVVPPHIGLTTADADNWDPIFSLDQYDPNWAPHQTSGFGGIACNDFFAITGTMQVQGTASVLHTFLFEQDLLEGNPFTCEEGPMAGAPCTPATADADCGAGNDCDDCSCGGGGFGGGGFGGGANCDPAGPDESCCAFSSDPNIATFCEREEAAEDNNVRATSVFKISNFASIIADPTVEVMEGDQEMWAYATSVLDIFLGLALPDMFPLEWTLTPNGLADGGMAPTCGRSGISASPTTLDEDRELDRLYTWTATECGGNIIIGDLDLSNQQGNSGGFDLYAFLDDGCPVALTETGAGNSNLWGARIGQCVGGNRYLFGTATLNNLQVDTDSQPPYGGWYLMGLDLADIASPFPPVTPP